MRVQAIAKGAFGAVRLFRLPFVKALLPDGRGISYAWDMPYADADEAIWCEAQCSSVRQSAVSGTPAVTVL